MKKHLGMIGCDTSFLISMFVEDRNHPRARDLLMAAEKPIFLSRLNLLEFETSIRRMIGSGELDEGKGMQAFAELETMRNAGALVEIKLSGENVWERAFYLSRRYSSELLVRSLDIWQVAFALEMAVTDFWTFDDRQKRLAAAVGLQINP